jgi:NADH-quinone oxidoreductase subunit H
MSLLLGQAAPAGGSGDPLLISGVHWAELAVIVVRVLVAFGVLLVSVMLMIWFERKLISDMQDRIGPNRAGPFGILQTLADGIKLFFKEDLLPERADPFVFKLAPYLSIVPALVAFTIVPVGGLVTVASHTFELQVVDPPIGILLLLAMSSISVYGVMLAGWSSGSKYPLLGAVRASAQMVSYEAALGLTIVTTIIVTGTVATVGSLSTRAIVDSQAAHFWDWNVIRLGVVPFLLFFIAITAELNRPPFDFAEAEQELVGGFHTEYSSIRFALFFLAEFMNTITMSAVVVTLFFGGPDGPVPHIYMLDWVFPIAWFLGKTIAFLFVYVWLRAALPRLRYDQLMDLGWKFLIPVSLAWLLLVAVAEIFGAGWPFWATVAVVIAAGGLLFRAVRVGRARGDLATVPGDSLVGPIGPSDGPASGPAGGPAGATTGAPSGGEGRDGRV